VAKMSKTDRSKCSGAGLQTRSCSLSPAAAAAQSTNVSELRWEIITPLGVPVDPDVYRMYARSVSIAPSSANGSPDSPATGVHGTVAAPWSGRLAAAPRSGLPGTPTTTTPADRCTAPARAAAWDALASSATITAAPLTFDLSVFDIFATCRAAACLTVLPEGAATFPVSIARFLEAERISVWYSVPSVLTLLACYGDLQQFDLSDLRMVIFAGEVFPPKHLARLMAELAHPRYLNWYGPTETNVCTAFEVPAGWAEAQPTPIGKACANTEVFAVTSEGRRVSQPGEEGELCVRGPSLMRGYWGQAAKTSEVLVRNPFRAEYDEFVYRTGDLVTLQADGNYAYTGRRDNMVKIRGYRVELGEVETTLYRHPAIREAAVLPTQDELLGTRLRAVVTTDGGGNLAREEVLDHCRQWLPSYMVPDIVEFREEMPRTSTGKVDRAGLAQERNELMLAGDGRRNKR
jgi:acyl-coenzyme A synthetase/AMP-(fatty) acid ligase